MHIKMGPYEDYITSHSYIKHIEKYVGEKVCDRIDDFIQPILNVLWNNRCWNRRKIKIRIDHYDTWSMDHTLAFIIVPMLKQLKATKHGAPFVDDEDVPVELKSINAEPLTEEQKNIGEVDNNHFKRWDWILDEMIWAFEQDALDDGWENQYYSGNTDYTWKLINPEESDTEKQLYEMKTGPNHTFKVDREGIENHQKRMDNGRRLFAKYYNSLWD